MNICDCTSLTLSILAILGILSRNNIITIAVLILLIIRLTPMEQFFPWIEKQGFTIGIIILTVSILTPIANGKVSPFIFFNSFIHWQSILAIVIGIIVSWLGGKGIILLSKQPSIVAGLLMGTVLGVTLFRGMPVGPLIAAGILSLLIHIK